MDGFRGGDPRRRSLPQEVPETERTDHPRACDRGLGFDRGDGAAPALRHAPARATTRVVLVAGADASGVARRIAPHFVNAKIMAHPAAKPE
jgi:hypothetical protein